MLTHLGTLDLMFAPIAHVSGTIAPLEILPITVATILYLHRVMTLAMKGRPVPVWRQICFGSGLALILIALFSPIGHISEELVLAHMTEHLLLGDIATLLLVLGLTGPLIQPILSIKIFDRLKILAHPAVAFPLWAVNLYFWHIPVIYQAAFGAAPVHALEHGAFIFFGCLMWMPLAGPLPTPKWFGAGWKIAYVIGVRFVGVVLGNIFMWSGSVLYPKYGPGEAYWGISPIADQSTAGVIMMLEGTFLIFGVLAWVFLKAAREGMESQRLDDLAVSRGIALAEGRARRAVESGHGALLEKRLRSGATSEGK